MYTARVPECVPEEFATVEEAVAHAKDVAAPVAEKWRDRDVGFRAVIWTVTARDGRVVERGYAGLENEAPNIQKLAGYEPEE